MAKNQVKRVAIYDRLSKDRTGDAESVENHVAACRQYIEGKGWTVAGEPFIDRDISGWKKKFRPQFAAVLKGITAGDFDAICVWKLDRFGRRMVTAVKHVEAITDAGAELLSVSDAVDTSTALGRGVLALMFSMAEGESESISKRVSLAWEAKAAKGEPHVGGRRCFGYSKNMKQIPAEAKAGRWAIDRLLAGDSARSVARGLNEKKVLTAAGKLWTHASVRQWASAPALAGIRTHKGTEVEGIWKAIITPAERERLLVRLGDARPANGGSVQHRWLLTGLVRCGACGGRMAVSHGRNYSCERCQRVHASRRAVDEHVIGIMFDRLSSARIEPLPADQDPRVLETTIEDAEAALADLNRSRFVLREISPEEWKPQRDALAERLEGAREALMALDASQGELRPGVRQDLVAWWALATIEQQRAAVRDSIRSITIRPTERRGCKFDTARITIRWKLLTGAGWRIIEAAGDHGLTEEDWDAYQATLTPDERYGTPSVR